MWRKLTKKEGERIAKDRGVILKVGSVFYYLFLLGIGIFAVGHLLGLAEELRWSELFLLLLDAVLFCAVIFVMRRIKKEFTADLQEGKLLAAEAVILSVKEYRKTDRTAFRTGKRSTITHCLEVQLAEDAGQVFRVEANEAFIHAHQPGDPVLLVRNADSMEEKYMMLYDR